MKYRVQAEWNPWYAPGSPATRRPHRVWVVRTEHGRKVRQFSNWPDAFQHAKQLAATT